LEWDARIPDFPVVHAEVLKARQYMSPAASVMLPERRPLAAAVIDERNAETGAVPHPLHLVGREVQ
jgi:hypothetical protein